MHIVGLYSSKVKARVIGPRVVVAALVALGLVVICWEAVPSFLSFVHVELGGIAYERGLSFRSQRPEEPNPYLDRALRHFQRAVELDRGNAHAWRKLGELYLTLGQNEGARWALETAVSLRPKQPLYRVLLGDALDGLGLAREAVQTWAEGRGKLWRQEQFLVNLMKMADAHIQAGDPLSSLPYLRDQVLALEPSNLFALAMVVSTYDGVHPDGHDPFVDPYRELLSYPEPEALRVPADPRYGQFQASAALTLWQRGYWDNAMVERVLRLWAWQRHPGAIALAQSLLQAEPDNETWPFLLAEALWRSDRLDEAEAILTNLENEDERVQRLRALLAWSKARQSREQLYWQRAREELANWQAAAPDDLLPVAGLMEAAEALEDVDALAFWRHRFAAMTADVDRQAAAEALGVSPEAVKLGPNLVTNSSFESWADGRPVDWAWSFMATGQPWNRGLFIGGPEEIGPSGRALRVDCLWVQHREGLEPARAGYWHYDEVKRDLRQIPVEPGSVYVVSFNYRTEGVGGNDATIWLSYKPSPCWAGDRGLPPTGGRWRHVAFVCAPAQEGDDPLRPLLRLFGPGTALFDDFAIRVIEIRHSG